MSIALFGAATLGIVRVEVELLDGTTFDVDAQVDTDGAVYLCRVEGPDGVVLAEELEADDHDEICRGVLAAWRER